MSTVIEMVVQLKIVRLENSTANIAIEKVILKTGANLKTVHGLPTTQEPKEADTINHNNIDMGFGGMDLTPCLLPMQQSSQSMHGVNSQDNNSLN